jgi:hypothetical protein
LETVAPVEETDIPLLKPIIVDSSKLNLRNLGVRREIVKAPAKTVTITKEDSPSTSQEKPEPVTAADFPPEAPVTKALSALEQLKERVCPRISSIECRGKYYQSDLQLYAYS